MSKFIDLTGERFGRLTVMRRSGNYVAPSGGQYAAFECKCDCGKTAIVTSHSLRTGATRSCGCLHDEKCRERRIKHGESGSKLDQIWKSMKQRCVNPNSKDYKNYGGRGIAVCEKWSSDYTAFSEWARENGYREGLTIDRIDVNGDYCPENCRWVSQKVQANNTTRNRWISAFGEVHTISEWADKTGLKYRTIIQRINLGWEPERALTEKARKGRNQWN